MAFKAINFLSFSYCMTTRILEGRQLTFIIELVICAVLVAEMICM